MLWGETMINPSSSQPRAILSQRKGMEKSWLQLFSLVLALSNAALAILVISRFQRSTRNSTRSSPRAINHSFVGRDYPREWDIGPLDRVYMPQEDTIHYALNSTIGDAQWSTMLPANGSGIIHLGPNLHPFSIGIFHQLKCLNILRVALTHELNRYDSEVEEQSDLVQHCMSYIRQMILCRSELRLENVKSPHGRSVTNSDVTHTCKDWSAVYAAAEANHQHYLQVHQSRSYL